MLLAIATNIAVLLMTAFVLQRHTFIRAGSIPLFQNHTRGGRYDQILSRYDKFYITITIYHDIVVFFLLKRFLLY